MMYNQKRFVSQEVFQKLSQGIRWIETGHVVEEGPISKVLLQNLLTQELRWTDKKLYVEERAEDESVPLNRFTLLVVDECPTPEPDQELTPVDDGFDEKVRKEFLIEKPFVLTTEENLLLMCKQGKPTGWTMEMFDDELLEFATHLALFEKHNEWLLEDRWAYVDRSAAQARMCLGCWRTTYGHHHCNGYKTWSLNGTKPPTCNEEWCYSEYLHECGWCQDCCLCDDETPEPEEEEEENLIICSQCDMEVVECAFEMCYRCYDWWRRQQTDSDYESGLEDVFNAQMDEEGVRNADLPEGWSMCSECEEVVLGKCVKYECQSEAVKFERDYRRCMNAMDKYVEDMKKIRKSEREFREKFVESPFSSGEFEIRRKEKRRTEAMKKRREEKERRFAQISLKIDDDSLSRIEAIAGNLGTKFSAGTSLNVVPDFSKLFPSIVGSAPCAVNLSEFLVKMGFKWVHWAQAGYTWKSLLVCLAELAYDFSILEKLRPLFESMQFAQAGSSEVFSGIAALVIAGTCIGSGCVPKATGVRTFMQNFALAGRCMSSVTTLTPELMRLWNIAVEYIRTEWFGLPPQVIPHIEIFDTWCKKIEELVKVDFESSLSHNEPLKAKLDELLIEEREVFASLDKMKFVAPGSRLRFQTCATFLAKAREAMGLSGTGYHRSRVPPMLLHLFGPTGQGKSSLIPYINSHILASLGHTDPTQYEKMVYSRDSSQERWDGYHNSIKLINIDDFGLARDSISNPNLDGPAVLRMINEAPMMLVMAGLADKGNTYCNPEAVILTSNLPSYNFESMTNPQAVVRRVDLKFSVNVREEYGTVRTIARESVRVVDQQKIKAVLEAKKAEDPEFDDLDVYGDIWEFRQYDPSSESESPISEVMHFSEFIDCVVSFLHKKRGHGKEKLEMNQKMFARAAKKYVAQMGWAALNPLALVGWNWQEDTVLPSGDVDETVSQRCLAEVVIDNLPCWRNGKSSNWEVRRRAGTEKVDLRGVKVVKVPVECVEAFAEAYYMAWLQVQNESEVFEYDRFNYLFNSQYGNWNGEIVRDERPTSVLEDPRSRFQVTRDLLEVTIAKTKSFWNGLVDRALNASRFEKTCAGLAFIGVGILAHWFIGQKWTDAAAGKYWCKKNIEKHTHGLAACGKYCVNEDLSIAAVKGLVPCKYNDQTGRWEAIPLSHQERMEAWDWSRARYIAACDAMRATAYSNEVYKAGDDYYTFASESYQDKTAGSKARKVESFQDKTQGAARRIVESPDYEEYRFVWLTDIDGEPEDLALYKNGCFFKVCKKHGGYASLNESTWTRVQQCDDCVQVNVFGRVLPRNAQGNVDQNAREVERKIKKNTFRLQLEDKGDVFSLGSGLMIKGRMMLTNRHILTFIMGRPQGKLVLKQDRMDDIVFGVNEICVCPIEDEEMKERDAAIFECPRAVPCRADLTHLFMTQADFGRHVELKVPTVLGYDRDGWRIRHGTRAAAVDRRIEINSMEGSFHVRQYYQYDIQTERGDCGSVFMCYDNARERKIAGIHMSDNPDPFYTACAAAISREYLLSKFSSRWWRYDESFLDGDFVQPAFNAQMNDDEDVPFEGSFIHHGRAPNMKSPDKTAIRPSPLHGEIQTPITKPAYLTRSRNESGNIVDPLPASRAKASTPIVCLDDEIVQRCKNHLQPLVNRGRKEIYQQVFEVREAIAGVPADPYLTGIKRQTSPGFGWNGKGVGKEPWLGSGPEYVTDNPELLARVALMKERALEGRRTGTIWTDTLKDERRPIEKVEAGKTRLFAAGEMAYLVLFRQYFMGFAAHMAQNRITVESCVGITPYGMEWTQLANRLRTLGNNIVAGDFSNYDGTLNAHLLWTCLDIINDYYGDSEENKKIRRALWLDIVQSVHITTVQKGTVAYFYEWTHSQPSGCPITAILNSLYHSLAARYVYVLCARKYAPEMVNLSNFSKYVRHNNYGDDDLYSIDGSIVAWYNQETMTEMFASLGMVYTDEAKTGVIVPTRRLEEVKFLKRAFVYDKSEGRWMAPLALETILEMAMWVKGKSNDEELTIQTVESAVEELGCHEQSVFNKHVVRFRQAMDKKLSVAVSLPTFSEMRETYQQRFIVEPGRNGVTGAVVKWSKDDCSKSRYRDSEILTDGEISERVI